MNTNPASRTPLADTVKEAVNNGSKFANNTLEAAHDKVDSLRQQIPAAVDHAAERIERVKQKAVRAYDGTTTYVREEPVKAVLIAAAAGALLAGAFGIVKRMRSSRSQAKRTPRSRAQTASMASRAWRS